MVYDELEPWHEKYGDYYAKKDEQYWDCHDDPWNEKKNKIFFSSVSVFDFYF